MESIEKKFNRGQNVVVEKFVPTIDVITSYHLYSMFIMLFDLVTYFINKTATFNQITPKANITIAVFIMVSEIIDLCIVACFGITRKVKWFTASYILYSASSISTIVALVMILWAKQSFEQAFSWQLGFLSIFRGNVRSVLTRNKKKENKLLVFLTKQSNVKIVSYIIYITRVVRAIFSSLYGVLIFIFIFMGTVFLNERAQESKRSFIELLYFITVTMSTVGYGDVILDGSSGRIITLIFIVIALVYIPVALGISIQKLGNELPKLKLLRQVYGGVIAIGQKQIRLAQSLRAVFPQQQSISLLIQDANQNYDDHPDMKQFIESVTQMQFMIKDQYSIHTLRDMQLDSSLIVLVYSDCDATSKDMAQADGETITQAVKAAQSLKSNNFLVVILQTESSVIICQDKIYEYLNKEQCIVYSLSRTFSQIIYISALFNGFSTYFINCMLPNNCQLNRFENENKIKENRKFKGMLSCCQQQDHEQLIQNSQYNYNNGCGKKETILNSINNLTEITNQGNKQEQLKNNEIIELLIVISGEFNEQLLNSTLSLLRKQNIKLYIIIEDSVINLTNKDDIQLEGDIYDSNFYISLAKDIIVFISNNDGKNVLIQHAIKQSGLQHNICCMESLVQIQYKFDFYKLQNYIPCGLSSLCTLVVRNPISFQKIFDFFEKNHDLKQYLIQETITVQEWQNIYQGLIIIYINREGLIINIVDNSFELDENDIITVINQ